jgi:hypothetical protein
MIDRLTDRQRHEFALRGARRVRGLMRDPRSIAALDTRERWLRGEASDKEMAAALAAAWAAAAAARAAALDAAAASAAAPAAALDAAAAAWAAARDAEDAARAAARDAERAWQREELERMLKDGGGA